MAQENSKTHSYQPGKDYAIHMDEQDPLRSFRERFFIPKRKRDGEEYIYLCGNSLGLQPKNVEAYVGQELKDWADMGVEGHFHARHPWMPYHEYLTDSMARTVGAKPVEVVVMNTLSVNLHLMMVSFYQPTSSRYKILIENDAFPSDRYAVEAQVKFHGYDPDDAIIVAQPREGEEAIRWEDLKDLMETRGEEIALILMGGVNYYTGQYFDMKKITWLGHSEGCKVGFDLAHGAGNLPLDLHATGADFAVWCTYKYLNSGPGSLGGCFIHERHAHDFDLPRFAGWWGHDKATRFNMRYDFNPIPGAEGWQLSNPPILPLAAMRASFEIFDEAGMKNLREKSVALTGYMEFLVDRLHSDRIRIITPRNAEERGCQLSVQVKNSDKTLFDKIHQAGVIADWREPDVIRVAAVPLYNSFLDVYRFVKILGDVLNN